MSLTSPCIATTDARNKCLSHRHVLGRRTPATNVSHIAMYWDDGRPQQMSPTSPCITTTDARNKCLSHRHALPRRTPATNVSHIAMYYHDGRPRGAPPHNPTSPVPTMTISPRTTVHSRDGGGVDAGWGPLRASVLPIHTGHFIIPYPPHSPSSSPFSPPSRPIRYLIS